MPGKAEDVEETEEKYETDEVPTDTSAPRDALGEGDGSDEDEIDRYSCTNGPSGAESDGVGDLMLNHKDDAETENERTDTEKERTALADGLLEMLRPTEIPLSKALYYATCSVEEHVFKSEKVNKEKWGRLAEDGHVVAEKADEEVIENTGRGHCDL